MNIIFEEQSILPDSIILKLKNKKNEIRKISKLFVQRAKEIPLSQDTINDIAVSLEEILMNIMRHGYGESDDVSIHVKILFEKHHVKIKIEDTAKLFNPLNYKQVNLEQYFKEHTPGGGLGLHIVKKLMDEINYHHENGRNILAMKKNYEIDS